MILRSLRVSDAYLKFLPPAVDIGKMKPKKDGVKIGTSRASGHHGLRPAPSLRRQDSTLTGQASDVSESDAQLHFVASNLSDLMDSTDFLEESQRIGALDSYVVDIPTGLWKGSNSLDVFFGMQSRRENTGASWFEIIHQEDRTRMAERRVHGIGKLEFEPQGKSLKMRGAIRDITECKQAEQAQRDS